MNAMLLNSTKKLLIVFFFSLSCIACKKEIPQQAVETPVQINSFSLSQSKVTLLQDNTGNTALSVNWQTNASSCGKSVSYTLEMSLDGSDFEDKLEVTTSGNRIDFTTDSLNRQLSKLIPPGTSAKIAMRVRTNQAHSNGTPNYSDAEAVWVNTYQDYRRYDYPQYLKIPGNYQSWILSNAPQIVSEKNDGEYEGYINFTNTYPQFLMVKGNQWTTQNTFEYIGSNKLGFGGSMFSVFGGAGIYLLKASTNTNTWAYTKINNWTLHGSAVTCTNTDPEMIYDNATQTWSVIANLQKGEFRIRSNNDDKNSLGQKMINGYMVPSAAGSSFVIEKTGSYLIKLNLLLAGNYGCSVVKQVNQ